jgi:nitrilase
VAAVQASYVLLNRAACMDKAVTLIDQAARQGARIVVLPESFIPGTPIWIDSRPIWDGPGIFRLNVDTAPRSSWSST